jgi:cytochrome b561
MTDLEFSPRKLMLYGWHEWIGLTVWALAVARILWRRRHPPPAALASIPPWQHRIAELVHWTLYGLLLALPLIGWAGNSALGFQVVLYGVLPLPPLAPEHKALGFTLLALHGWLGWGMLLLVGMHAGAALQHHFLARDATLRRMLPRGRWGGER